MDANAIQRISIVKFSTSLFFLTASTSALHAGVDFNHQIVPLLRKHCGECHTGDKLKGGFSMNDRAALLHGSENGPVVEPGKTEKSLLLEVVTTTDEDLRMPPKGAGLSPAEADLLKQWIAEGLPWESGFAFKAPAYEPPLKPRSVTLPPAINGRENPVDRLIDATGLPSQVVTATGALGGGTAMPQEHHSAAMPPQASIARRTSDRLGGTSAGGASSSADGLGSWSFVTASDRYSEQICGPSRVARLPEAGRLAQHVPSADFSGDSSSARCRSRSRRIASSTRRALAQANRSAAVWQQHLAKHCFADPQPQGLFMQGKGFDRSFSAKRAATDPSSVPMGSGRPDATSA